MCWVVFFCAGTQPWCLGEYLLQPGVLTYPTPDAASPRNGRWLITWWVIILCSGGADWRMILAVPLPVKGKWVMCVLGLLKGREHHKYPTFREVLSMKKCGKRTSETEQNSDAEHYYQITVWYHHHPTYLFDIILCHKRVRRFFPEVHYMFFHPLWSDYVMNFKSNPRRWEESTSHQKPQTAFLSRSWAVAIWGTNAFSEQ